MRNLSTRVRRFSQLLPLLFACLAGGCATRGIWINRNLDNYHEPAAPHHVAIYEAPEKKDFLVVYDDLSPSGNILRRAYLLKENQAATAAGKKPRFQTEDLKPLGSPIIVLPTSDNVSSLNERGVPYAVLSSRTNRFALYEKRDKLIGEYDLPIYATASGNVKRVLLTPLTLAADVTIVGGVIAAFALTQPATYESLANIH